MKHYQILLIDQDPDEHLLVESALRGITIPVNGIYCSDAREAVQLLNKKEIPAPDYILFSIAYPTRQEDILMSELSAAVRGEGTRIFVYGLDERPFTAFLERHKCHFLPKCVSLDQLQQALFTLLSMPCLTSVYAPGSVPQADSQGNSMRSI